MPWLFNSAHFCTPGRAFHLNHVRSTLSPSGMHHMECVLSNSVIRTPADIIYIVVSSLHGIKDS